MVLSEIDGNAVRRPPVKRPRNIRSGCLECQVTLCIARACFDNYHLYIHNKMPWNTGYKGIDVGVQYAMLLTKQKCQTGCGGDTPCVINYIISAWLLCKVDLVYDRTVKGWTPIEVLDIPATYISLTATRLKAGTGPNSNHMTKTSHQRQPSCTKVSFPFSKRNLRAHSISSHIESILLQILTVASF